MKYEERHRDLRDATENWVQDMYVGDAPAWSLAAHAAQNQDVVSVYGDFNRRTSALVDKLVAAVRVHLSKPLFTGNRDASEVVFERQVIADALAALDEEAAK